MTKTKDIAYIALAAAAIFLGSIFIAYLMGRVPNASASVARGGEYNATNTRSVLGVSMLNGQNLTSTTTTTPGTLGSIIIEGAAAGQINLYDATTTNVTLRAASMSTTSITVAVFPTSVVAGVYTFDTTFANGLLVELIGTTPTSTITYRLN